MMRRTKQKQFYDNAFSRKYFQLSNETVFETVLLGQLHSSILIQASSFRSFAASYNYTRGYYLKERSQLNYKRLVEIYYSWQLCRYYHEFKQSALIGIYYS